jgi:hypothetical protein
LKQKKSKRDLLQKQIDKLYDKTLKPVRMDTTYKRSCVTWAKNTSDSVVNYRVTLKHTKTYGRYSEVITGGGFGCNLNDSVSKFSVFVKKVCGKSLKGLSNVELLALASLYSWDQSKLHNEILNNPTQVKGYFSSYFQFNERSNKNNTRSYFSFSFVSIVQLKN